MVAVNEALSFIIVWEPQNYVATHQHNVAHWINYYFDLVVKLDEKSLGFNLWAPWFLYPMSWLSMSSVSLGQNNSK